MFFLCFCNDISLLPANVFYSWHRRDQINKCCCCWIIPDFLLKCPDGFILNIIENELGFFPLCTESELPDSVNATSCYIVASTWLCTAVYIWAMVDPGINLSFTDPTMNTVPTVQFQNKILKSKFLFWPLLHCRQLNHILRRLVPAIHILFFNVCYNTILFVFHVTGHSVVFVVEGTWVYALDFGGSDGKRVWVLCLIWWMSWEAPGSVP